MSVPDLEVVADIYNAATSGAPSRTVAEVLGITRGRARDWVHRARVAGLIPPTTQGKATGQRMTAKARLAEELDLDVELLEAILAAADVTVR